MKLRTEIDVKPFERSIDYSDGIFMIGSCFAQNIGERIKRAKFHATINPSGVLFNPLSICNTLQRLWQRHLIESSELEEEDWGWHHFDFHSSLSAPTREATCKRINDSIESASVALREASCVVITLGTAWVYESVESGRVVANCHKKPACRFLRRRASVEEIAEQLKWVIDGPLRGKHIILTISPIRHVADGLSENSLSKATLRLAVDQILSSCEGVDYFPSYEILMDDLRDYRFYAADLVHPSELAVDYIWDIFTQTALSERSKELMQRVLRVVKAAEHRPLNPSCEAHRKLCETQLRAIAELKGVDLSEESRYFCEQLEINL